MTSAELAQPPAAETQLSITAADPVQQLRQQGLREMRAGRPGGAEAYFRRLVETDPGQNQSHLLLYRSLLAQQRDDAAQTTLVDALGVVADPAAISVVLAHRLLADGDATGARRLLESYRPSERFDVDYEALLAAAYERSGDFDAAFVQYTMLTASQPQHGAWWIGLGIACEGLGRAAGAIQAFSRARDTPLEPALERYAAQRLAVLDKTR